jgi:putative transposase
MARGGTSVEAGGAYHVISRFVNNEWLMKGAVERNMYLSLFGHSIVETDWRCFAYALMSSHLHLGLVAGNDAFADWFRPMHTKFANWLNIRCERIGAVFVRGPNVVGVQPEGTARLISYIHCNPVRAGVVANAEDSTWTSHRAYVGVAPRPQWLDVANGLQLAKLDDGHALDAWMKSTSVDRAELDAFRTHPAPRRGRPPKSEASEIQSDRFSDES